MADLAVPSGHSKLEDSPGDDSLNCESLLEGIRDLFDEGDYSSSMIEDAIARFEEGDYAAAETQANEALATKQKHLQDVLPDEQLQARLGGYEKDNKLDKWRMALERLATTYGDASETDQAEAIYLRMLAWREGVEQQESGLFALASGMFKKSMEYNSIEDATWFLKGLRPDDGHAVPEVLPLLALGERVAAKAAVAAWTLALRPKHRPLITERGGLELLTKALAQYPDNVELAAAGCGALRLLCQGHSLAIQNRKSLTANPESLMLFTMLMRLHKDDIEVQRETCGALGALATDNPAGAANIVAKEGIMLCLEAFVTCPDRGVGDAACKALATICGRSQGLLAGRGPEGTVLPESTAAEYAGNVDLQVSLRSECERGLRYCLNQLHEELSQKHPPNDRTILQYLLWSIMIFLDDSGMRHLAMHVVPSVVNCMKVFPGHPQIQVPACGIIWRLTVGHQARDEAVQKVAMAGGVGPICQSMKDLPCARDLQQVAIGALRNIAFGNDANKTLIVRAGGLAATITGMKRYPKDAELQEQAIGALTSLCDTVGRAAICARLGGVDVIIGALRRHAEVGHIAELGCIILCMFCDDQQLKHLIVRSGALQIAKKLSRTENTEAQQWGCELLHDLSDN
jgi:hypothetical protein